MSSCTQNTRGTTGTQQVSVSVTNVTDSLAGPAFPAPAGTSLLAQLLALILLFPQLLKSTPASLTGPSQVFLVSHVRSLDPGTVTPEPVLVSTALDWQFEGRTSPGSAL